MKIAVLGANSYIAKDLIISFSKNSNYDLKLFARTPKTVKEWFQNNSIKKQYSVYSYGEFNLDIELDAIINFVGVGDPAKAKEMGASILDITYQYDDLAIKYVKKHPECKYVFLSSGAVYNYNFDKPVDSHTSAIISLNTLQAENWYGIAKLYTECRHRSLSELPIIDIRIFNYFSHKLDITTRFFMSDILRAIEDSNILLTSPDNIVRDYIGPNDFYKLIVCAIESEPRNDVFDCYTKGAVDKITILKAMRDQFGLTYKYLDVLELTNATGIKMNYFSNNHRAEEIGYVPTQSSLDLVIKEANIFLNERNSC